MNKEERNMVERSKKLALDFVAERLKSMDVGFPKVTRILEGEPSLRFESGQYMQLYTDVYNLCILKKTQTPAGTDVTQVQTQVYHRYESYIDKYINTTVLPSLREKHGRFLLMELVQRWSNHHVMVRWLSRFFDYLDRYYVQREKLPNIKDAGFLRFRELVYCEIHERAKDAVIALINQERDGQRIDRVLFKSVVDFFVSIGIDSHEFYTKDLEEAVLEETSAYYSRIASDRISDDTCPAYMLMAEQRLIQEKERSAGYLYAGTSEKVLERAQHELLFVHETQLLEKGSSGLRALLRDRKTEDLTRMYQLYCKVPGGLAPITAIFKQHVIEDGLALVKEATEAANNKANDNKEQDAMQGTLFIRKVLELHDEHMGNVLNCFGDNNLIHKALKEAFEVFCNKVIADMTSSELLAIFAEGILKKGSGSEKLSDADVEVTLEKIVRLLDYIHEKDLFAEFHRKRLARRLLGDRSADDEHERMILSKLKQLFGAQLTSKMGGMLKDLTLAKDNQAEFRNYLYDTNNNLSGKLNMDMSVTVLTSICWPTYKSPDINLPAEMVTGIEAFKKHYTEKTKRRMLTWVFSLGSCTLLGKFDMKPIELIVTTYQAAVLMLFNDSQRLSYSEIIEQLKLNDEDVIRLLHSMSCAKYKILRKEPDTKTISKRDVFEINSAFTDKMRRIRLPLPPIDEKKKTSEDVAKHRCYAIDAAIVRIMKSRKVLGYQNLVGECIQHLSHSFKPDVRMIKKRIEDLIQRDYLERDNSEPNTFKYLA